MKRPGVGEVLALVENAMVEYDHQSYRNFSGARVLEDFIPIQAALKKLWLAERPGSAEICSATSRTRDGRAALTCSERAGHKGPHVDPVVSMDTHTGFWWTK